MVHIAETTLSGAHHIRIGVKRLTETANWPYRATEGSAGFDLCVDNTEPVVLEPRSRVKIDTGLAFSIPPGHVMLLFARSGLAYKHGIQLTNGVGVIDSDYRNEVGALLYNTSDKPFTIEPGMRMMQAVVIGYPNTQYVEVDELDETDRNGGYGSTGI